MKLVCIESVQMIGEKEEHRYQAFSEGKEYNARKGSVKGIDGDPYSLVEVLRARNDRGESHIIKRLASDELNEFFHKHFKILK
ncbi:hypothetical protein AB1L07_02165 [Niallia alba]|uniref:hypothetical protein n=1 Tax=Niallia alba TaxID=2729105 RepID=UPI0039A14AD7